MIQIIKTEFYYIRELIIAASVIFIAVVFVIAFGVNEINTVPSQFIVIIAAVVFTAYMNENQKIIQLRDRLLTLLPVKRKQIAYSRMSFGLVIYIMFIIQFYLVNGLLAVIYTSKFISPGISEFLVLTGLILILNSVHLISRDLVGTAVNKAGRMFFGILKNLLVFIYFIPFYIMMNVFNLFENENVLQNKIEYFLSSGVGIVVSLGLGIAISYSSYLLFMNRKTFSNS
ncbi:MAG: ABC-2 transporter permease [Melioribacteraceae bacterium]|nr:ABC-2 transporter permease [Melioribacteraceae bacterium]MCF8353783.1 ABC-2 transporter permease [Melioribacteraceae bacterium]MCF8393619.1 ABC-2 transporter permease [Melioribacteraceae bacterium]MCF8419429.1 ABC-2 transporter permease [Melioribacteraceae bacterium]